MKEVNNRVLVDVEEGMEAPEWLGSIAPFACKVLDKLGKDDWEVSFLFCSAPFIRKLNNDYRDIDSETDILSFEDGTEYTDDDGNTDLDDSKKEEVASAGAAVKTSSDESDSTDDDSDEQDSENDGEGTEDLANVESEPSLEDIPDYMLKSMGNPLWLNMQGVFVC